MKKLVYLYFYFEILNLIYIIINQFFINKNIKIFLNIIYITIKK